MPNRQMRHWIRLDVDVLDHPKVINAGLYGRALWFASLTWSARMETDGALPAHVLTRIAHTAGLTLGDESAVADQLVRVGLWEATDHGWQIHDFEDWQETAEEREHRREISRASSRRARAKRPRDATVTRHDTRGDAPRDVSVINPEAEAEADADLSTYAAAKALRTARGDEIAAAEKLCIEIAKAKAARAIANGDAANPAAYTQHLAAAAIADHLPRVQALLALGTPAEQIIEQLSAPPKRASRRRKPTVAELLQGDGT